jgi:hypothetical protein
VARNHCFRPTEAPRKYFDMGERSQYFVDNVMGFAELFETFGQFDLGVISDSIADAGLTALRRQGRTHRRSRHLHRARARRAYG